MPQNIIRPTPPPDPEMMFLDQFNTNLTPEEERRFQIWAKQESARQGRNILMDLGAYDVRGYWKSGGWKVPDPSGRGHGPDTWKKPNHPTFSAESVYHNAMMPSGKRAIGGFWNGDSFTPGSANAIYYGIPNLIDYMQKYEPGVRLNVGRK